MVKKARGGGGGARAQKGPGGAAAPAAPPGAELEVPALEAGEAAAVGAGLGGVRAPDSGD